LPLGIDIHYFGFQPLLATIFDIYERAQFERYMPGLSDVPLHSAVMCMMMIMLNEAEANQIAQQTQQHTPFGRGLDFVCV
jgi:hypothetical protein